MPYVIPTVEEFQARFPEITATEPQITAAIAEATRRVDESWVEADYQPAILYYAAHLLTMNSGSVNVAGVVSETFGPISVTYAQGTSRLLATTYGEQFSLLLRLNKAGPRVANGS